MPSSTTCLFHVFFSLPFIINTPNSDALFDTRPKIGVRRAHRGAQLRWPSSQATSARQQQLPSFGGKSHDVDDDMPESEERVGRPGASVGTVLGKTGWKRVWSCPAVPDKFSVSHREERRSWTQPDDRRASAS